MSRSIDERIVQMTFKNEEFERRAKTTISTLGKLDTSLNPAKFAKNLSGMQAASERLDLTNIAAGLEKVNQGFSIMEQIAIGVFRNIGNQISGFVSNKIRGFWTSLTQMSDLQMFDVGYKKYNDLTASVQTLVNSTGKSVDEIDTYLDRLMWYSDETSFGFTDMTKALGTMVSAGGDIDKLIPMLMGIGNATAYAGKGAQEFTRVIYNLNQSYSSGALNTMDWRSIELAGVDSKVLKEQLIAVGKELGTIKKKSAGLSDFKQLLSDKVFTREVMEKAFTNFAAMTEEAEKLVKSGEYQTAADAIEALSGRFDEFAERAFKSAQEAKSFREAIEATQDAVSSGWMQTFKLIFGNYEQSKALWTDVTNTFWDLFASGAEKRNAMFKEWKSIWQDTDKAVQYFGKPFEKGGNLTQTQALINDLSDAILNFRDMLSALANETIDFPTIEAVALALFNAIEKIRGAIRGFIDDMNAPPIERSGLLRAFQSLYDAVLMTVKLFVTVGKEIYSSFIKPLASLLKPILEDIFRIFEDINEVVYKGESGIIKNLSPIQKFLKGILDILTPIINGIGGVIHWIRELADSIRNDSFKNGIHIFDGLAKSIVDFTSFVAGALNGSIPVLQTLGDWLKNIFGKVQESITNFLSGNGSNISKLAEGGVLGMFGIGLAKLIKLLGTLGTKINEIDFMDLGKNFSRYFTGGLGKGISDGITNIFDSLKNGLGGLIGGGKTAIDGLALKGIADAIMELALALLVLSLVDGTKIATSLGGLAAALGGIVYVITQLNKMQFANNYTGNGKKGLSGFFSNISASFKNLTQPNDFKTAIKAVKDLAFVILELSVALKILSTINLDQMAIAVAGLGVVLLELGIFIKSLGKSSNGMDGKNVKSTGKMLSKLGFALIEIAAALKIMASMNWGELAVGIVGMGAVLTELGIFIKSISAIGGGKAFFTLTALGPAMIGIGLSLIEIAAAMKILSTMDITGSNTAIVALFAALGTIGIFVAALSKLTMGGLGVIGVATGLLILSAAIGNLSLALITLSAIGWNQIKDGLKIFAAMLGILGGAGAILGVISPLLLLGAAALAAFGGALYVVSAAMLNAVNAFLTFKLIGGDMVSTMIDIMTDAFAAIIGLIPSFVLGIVQAIIGCAGQLLNMVSQLIQMVVGFITDNLGTVVNSIINFATTVLQTLIPGVTSLMPLLFDLVMAFLNGLNDGLIANMDTLVENLFNLLVTAIHSLANVVRSGGELGAALMDLASGLLEGLFGALGSVFSGIGKIGGGIVDGFKGLWDSLFSSGNETGASLPEEMATGIEENAQTAVNAADKLGSDTAEAMENSDKALAAAKDTVQGFTDFLTSGTAQGWMSAGFSSLGTVGINEMKKVLGIASPSKVMAEQGAFTVLGFVNGIYDNLKFVDEAGVDTANIMLDAIKMATDAANSALDGNLNPVITPVLDLTDVEQNSKSISSLLDSNASYNAALGIQPNRFAFGNQNGLNNPLNVNVSFTINEAGKELTEEDFTKFGKQISNIVNEELGGWI